MPGGGNSGFPRLLEVTEPFSIFPWGSRRTHVQNVPWPSSLPRRQSGHLSPLPAISAPPALVKPGSAADFGSEPRQVAVESSPEGDPALVWVRPDGRLPVTCFPGAQTELFSNHILITLGEKTRGLGDFFKKYVWGPGVGDTGLPGRVNFLLFITNRGPFLCFDDSRSGISKKARFFLTTPICRKRLRLSTNPGSAAPSMHFRGYTN